MNTQLAEQHTEQVLPLGEAMEQLLAAYHADAAEVEQLLRRFKSQNWKLTDSDVKSIAMQN